ncbi:MAG: hypothetical protein R2757_08170 [Draconibacterium sp.]
MKSGSTLLILVLFYFNISYAFSYNDLTQQIIEPVSANELIAENAVVLADCPTLAVSVINPAICGGTGTLNFTFTNVPDGTYTINFDGGSFQNVSVTSNQAQVSSLAKNYTNLRITVESCASPGVNAIVSDPEAPAPPIVNVEDNCGESVLTVSDYTGSLLWNTGETTEAIIVTEPGNFSVTQSVNQCVSEPASVNANPKIIPVTSVTENNPEECSGLGSLDFTFDNVPDGTYTILYDGGNFSDVSVINNLASVSTGAGNYNNLTISVNGCSSASGVNATLTDPNPPLPPTVSVENLCGESVLTASNYTGELLWNTGENTESITITEAGEYSVTQTITGCKSDAAKVNAAPHAIPVISVSKTDPEECSGLGSLDFTFDNVPNGTYTILYDGGNFSDVSVSNNLASVSTGAGNYNNLTISVDGCSSASGVNVSLTDPAPPNAPFITVENDCGESVLTASNYTGTLNWSTGETTESIVVTEAGDYSVKQIINGCTSSTSSAVATPKITPTISVLENNPADCLSSGSLDFTFTGVPNGIYTIWHDAGSFAGVTVTNNKASVLTNTGTYTNLIIIVNGCTSPAGVIASLIAPSAPDAPGLTVENNCGESVLTASNYTGTLNWSTGETVESIIVTEPGNYTITQTVNGCTSDFALVTASPKIIPTLSVIAHNPSSCDEPGSFNFTFTNVSDGKYTISYDGGNFPNVNVINNSATVLANAGTYNNLTISVNGCFSESGVNATISKLEIEGKLGTSDVLSYISNDPTVRAVPVTSLQNATIKSISIYHEGGTGKILLGVYADASGLPGSRIGITPSTSINIQPGWQTIQLTNPVNVTPGQKVWLAWVFENNPGIRYSIGKPGRASTLKTWADGMPSNFYDSKLADYNYSIYCSYTYTEPPSAPIVTVENLCGSSLLSAFGYSGTLQWSTGATTASITVTEPGSYTVTQTAGGCTSDAATAIATPKIGPTLSVAETDPEVCMGEGLLEFSFTEVTDGEYTIKYDQGEFNNVSVSNGKGQVSVLAGSYFNLTIEINGCSSPLGVNAVLSSPDAPEPPQLVIQDNCGESVLTATNYDGTLYWNTGETTIKSISIYHEGGTGRILLPGVYADASGLPAGLV